MFFTLIESCVYPLGNFLKMLPCSIFLHIQFADLTWSNFERKMAHKDYKLNSYFYYFFYFIFNLLYFFLF